MPRFSISSAFGAAAVLVLPSTALALDCKQIMDMLAVNVPANIVVDTIKNGGALSAQDVSYLQSSGAPAEVVNAASAQVPAAVAPAPSPAAPAPTGPGPAPLGGDLPAADPLGGGLGDDLPDAGEPIEEGGPGEIEQLIEMQRAGKNLTASKGLFDLLQANKYPQHTTKIDYYLAKALEDMGMLSSAEFRYMRVAAKGPSNPYFNYAMPKLIGIAERTGDDTQLLRIVDKIPPETFPRGAKNRLHYLLGRKLFEEDSLTAAAANFQQVSAKSDLYMRSKYYEGVINREKGKLKSAVMAFREVMVAQPPVLTGARQAQEVEDMKDLALINIARIYFGLERFDNADTYYEQVERDSSYWPQSLFERAWTNFYLKDLNFTLGLLLTVESPYFNEEEYIPEVTILRALTFFNLCEYDTVDAMLAAFEEEHKVTRDELQELVDQYRQPGARDQLYDKFFVQPHEDTTLTQALFARVLRNRDLAARVDHIDMIEEEMRLIDQQRGEWRNSIGDALRRQLEKDRVYYKKKAGTALLVELNRQLDTIKDLLVQSEIIRFEVVDAQRKDYEYKASLDEVEVDRKDLIDYATTPDLIYWPFNGEFWRDELGYYRYTENGSCE